MLWLYIALFLPVSEPGRPCARASERDWQDAHGLRTAATVFCVYWWAAFFAVVFFFVCGFHLNIFVQKRTYIFFC